MSVNKRHLFTFDLQPVLLAPISDAEQVDTNLEPQFVRVRDGNITSLYLDSQKPYLQFNPSNIRMSSVSSSTEQPQILIQNVSRIAVENFEMFWVPVNITPYNQTYTWVYYDIGTMNSFRYTHTIGIGNYTLSQLLTFITNQMSDDIGAPGQFTFNIDATGYYASININTPSYQFYFDPTSPLVIKGANLLSLPISSTPVFSLSLGPARMIYTRYIDIFSSDLCQYIKNPSRSVNNATTNIIFRQSLASFAPNANSYVFTTPQIQNPNWINWNPEAPTASLQFLILDENGDVFYFQPNVPGQTTSFSWLMAILLEK